MRLLLLSFRLAACALFSGCASEERDVALDPVGPLPVPAARGIANGSLVVFSAYDVHGHFSSTDTRRRRHTDYKILSEDGKHLQTVHNDSGTLLEGPIPVSLPPGAYRIVARANGYGVVTLPVVLEANRVTEVHLEGGGSWGNRTTLKETEPVRLPDGRVVGWRAVLPHAS